MIRFIVTLFTLLGYFAASASADDGLGRLFLNADERRALDADRAARGRPLPVEPQVVAPPPVEVAAPVEPTVDKPVLRVDGYVKRDTTSGTVWINGVNTYDGDLRPMYVDHERTRIVGNKVQITALDGESSVTLKPGEGYDPERGKVADSYRLLPESSDPSGGRPE